MTNKQSDAAPAGASEGRQPVLLLVDGSSYLYRAFHAMPDLRVNPADPASQPTGAIRGMVNMLGSLRREWPQAAFAACVFDAPGPTFRDEIYPEYKAHRNPMPDDLRSQIAPIHEVVRLLGWPVLTVPQVEADDVIGTLARVAAGRGLQVVISSGDKDLAQLVGPQVSIIDTMNGKRRDEAGVLAEFGVRADQMLDFQTLVGDAVDNVPGVAKVGPKTAAKWLAEFGSLDAILAHADQIKGAAGENLRRALDWLPTGRRLLQIRTDCDLHEHVPGLPDLAALAAKEADEAALVQFYARYGFKSLAGKAGKKAAAPAPTPAAPGLFDDESAPRSAVQGQVRYTTVQDWPTFDAWLQKIEAAPLTAIDTETTSLDEMSAQLVGISLAVQPGEAAYIPLAHCGPDAPAQLPLAQVLARLAPWLQNPQRPKLGQNTKYDRHVFVNHGI